MAVSIEQVAIELRIIGAPGEELTPGYAAILNRLSNFADGMIRDRAPRAPEYAVDAAKIAIIAYWFDKPNAPVGAGFAAIWRNSSAASILSRWIPRRAVLIDGSGPVDLTQGPSGPATDARQGITDIPQVEAVAERIAVALLDAHTRRPNAHHVPPVIPPPQVADVAALIATHAALPNAHHVPPTLVDLGGDNLYTFSNTHAPARPVAMRLGYELTAAFTEDSFIRTGSHPEDGANEGLSSGLSFPPPPPSLSTKPNLYKGVWFAGDPLLVSIDSTGNLPTEVLGSVFLRASKVALTVGGVLGVYYPSYRRVRPSSGSTIKAIIRGPELLTETAAAGLIATHAALPNAHHVPPVAPDVAALIATHAALPNVHHVPPVAAPGAAGGAELIAEHTLTEALGREVQVALTSARDLAAADDNKLVLLIVSEGTSRYSHVMGLASDLRAEGRNLYAAGIELGAAVSEKGGAAISQATGVISVLFSYRNTSTQASIGTSIKVYLK